MGGDVQQKLADNICSAHKLTVCSEAYLVFILYFYMFANDLSFISLFFMYRLGTLRY